MGFLGADYTEARRWTGNVGKELAMRATLYEPEKQKELQAIAVRT